MKTLTAEYSVSGSLDGTTPAPPIIIDPTEEGFVPPSSKDQIYRRDVDVLGIIDPDLMAGVGGSLGPRLVSLLWIDAPAVGDPGATIDIVGVLQDGSVSLQTQVEDTAGKEGPYIVSGVLVPQGSALRLLGYTGPLIVRATVLAPENVSELALLLNLQP